MSREKTWTRGKRNVFDPLREIVDGEFFAVAVDNGFLIPYGK